MLIRLTQNLDKSRGFVNGVPSFVSCLFLSVFCPSLSTVFLFVFLSGGFSGAIAEIVESLDGNRVFVARLLSSHSHVLVHPVPYFDKRLGSQYFFEL